MILGHRIIARKSDAGFRGGRLMGREDIHAAMRSWTEMSSPCAADSRSTNGSCDRTAGLVMQVSAERSPFAAR